MKYILDLIFLILAAMLVLIFVILITAHYAHAWAPEYKAALESQLRWFIAIHPPYLAGGTDEKGIDCSGYLYRACQRAGIPVKRTTAADMAIGGGLWTGRDITLDEADHLDFTWWTFPSSPPRINGHVGSLFVGDQSGLLQVTHSGVSRGVVLDQLRGILLNDLSKVRRMTIGDSK